jgi:predicted kinase
VTRLIHLNGPPGIGKSTISALYADRHPGTLNLDIDYLHELVGGWRDPANRTHDVLRPVALAMAAAHLHGGRDVVLPQYLARPSEIDAFSDIATEQGADFFELILLDNREESIARFEDRPPETSWDEHNRHEVARRGGPTLLGAMYDQLLGIARQRPQAMVIRSEMGAIEETYASLFKTLL